MTPAAYVYGILADNIDSIPGLKSDDICTFYVDDSACSDVIVLITEEPGMGDDYGNDNFPRNSDGCGKPADRYCI